MKRGRWKELAKRGKLMRREKAQTRKRGVGTFVCLLVLAGCATHRGHVEKTLMDQPVPRGEKIAVAEAYRAGCPDVLEISVAGRPNLSCQGMIGADGSLVSPMGRIRVAGQTRGEIAQTVARRVGAPAGQISVRIADFNSQVVYLFGQVKGSHRSVPYEGPETVLELLQRAGGITPGAEPDDVYVVRPHITDGKRPEVFHVDLRAIVLHQDRSTNMRVQPFDQVHVGQTRQSQIERSMPVWLRPVIQAICDTRPADNPPSTNIGKRFAQNRRRRAQQSILASQRRERGGGYSPPRP